MSYTNQVFRITDLVKIIGSFKKEFELADDIRRLNDNSLFQQLILLIYNSLHDAGIITKNEKEERLQIKICFCLKIIPLIIIDFKIYEKYKKKHKYRNMFFINPDDKAYITQQDLSKFILDQDVLLSFFK